MVTTLEGPPSGDIASRIGGFTDVTEREAQGESPIQIIQTVLRAKNTMHDNYQDYQAFLDAGGCIGLQHDPLLYRLTSLHRGHRMISASASSSS